MRWVEVRGVSYAEVTMVCKRIDRREPNQCPVEVAIALHDESTLLPARPIRERRQQHQQQGQRQRHQR
jgi:hypothetical protein